VKYADVLASASPLRSRIAPVPAVVATQGDDGETVVPERRGTYRPWTELLKRTFDFDILQCASCGGRMKLLALVTDSSSVARTSVPSVNRPTHPGVCDAFENISRLILAVMIKTPFPIRDCQAEPLPTMLSQGS
jgi:hypothetical protein